MCHLAHILLKCGTREHCAQLLQADSMSPSPPQTVADLSTVERLFCQSSVDAIWQYVAALSGEAKQNGVEELLCTHCSTKPLHLTHTGHSLWGDTCHSCTVWGTAIDRQTDRWSEDNERKQERKKGVKTWCFFPINVKYRHQSGQAQIKHFIWQCNVGCLRLLINQDDLTQSLSPKANIRVKIICFSPPLLISI